MTAVPDAGPTDSVGTRLRERTFGIAALAVLFVLRALLLLAAFAGPSLPDLGPLARLVTMPAQIAAAIRETPVLGAVVVVLVAALVLGAVLMWRGRRSGWLIGILTTGLFLLVDLYQANRGDMNTVWMALDVVVVFYLNQRDVRDYFAIGAMGRQP
jgi:hypothetical protein